MNNSLYTNAYRTARLAATALACFSGLLLAAAGQLDPTFGKNGKVLGRYQFLRRRREIARVAGVDGGGWRRPPHRVEARADLAARGVSRI